MNKKNFATLGKLLLKFKLYVFFNGFLHFLARKCPFKFWEEWNPNQGVYFSTFVLNAILLFKLFSSFVLMYQFLLSWFDEKNW